MGESENPNGEAKNQTILEQIITRTLDILGKDPQFDEEILRRIIELASTTGLTDPATISEVFRSHPGADDEDS